MERPEWTPPRLLPELRLLRVRPTLWAYGKSAARDYIEEWSPVRWVRSPQVCSWCWGPIGVVSPGATTGTRGTKAFVCVQLGLWRHIDCHHEAQMQELDHRDALGSQLAEERESAPVAGPSSETVHG